MTAHARAITKKDAKHIEADIENVLRSIRLCLTEPTSQNELASAIECIIRLRSYMWQRGVWSAWSQDVKAAISASEHRELPHYAARLKAHLAGLLEARGYWKEVVDIANQVLNSTSDRDALIDALFHLGTAHHNLGRSRRSLRVYKKALQMSPDPATAAAINHKISRVLKTLGKKHAAQIYLDRAFEITRKTNDQWFYAELLLDKVGYVPGNLINKAMGLVEESLAIYSELVFVRGIAYCEVQRGRLLALLGDNRRSDKCLESALRRFRRESYLPGQVHAHFIRGLTRLNQGAVHAAHKDFREAVYIAKQAKYRRMIYAAAAGEIIAAIKGRTKALQTLFSVLCMRDRFKTLYLALLLQIKGAESILREGL